MNGFLRPVGDQPAAVYWGRRAVVLLAFAAVVILVWLIARALGSAGEPQPGASPSPTASPTNSVAASTATVACAEDGLAVTVAANPAAVAAGSPARFDVTVENTGTAPCVLDATGDATTLLITSGEDRIWSSGDCPAEASLLDAEWLLQPGDTQDATVAWPGIRSAEGCATVDAAPRAGTYRAELTLAGVAAEAARFDLQ